VLLDEIGKPIAWSGVLADHTGFQRMIPICAISAQLERLVERELKRHVRQMDRRQRKQRRQK
jgi:hypothetical protein